MGAGFLLGSLSFAALILSPGSDAEVRPLRVGEKETIVKKGTLVEPHAQVHSTTLYGALFCPRFLRGKDRMERSGMRWTARMAEGMVKMRATYLSGDFDKYWDYHVTREQERLYPKNRWKPPTIPSS